MFPKRVRNQCARHDEVEERNHRVSERPVGSVQVRSFSPKHEQCADLKHCEWPEADDEGLCQLLEGPHGDVQHRHCCREENGEMRCLEARVHCGKRAEERPVLSHGVEDARIGHEQAVQRPKRRQQHKAAMSDAPAAPATAVAASTATISERATSSSGLA